MENEIMYIKLDDIIPNRFQPREMFDEESLNKLADSIRQHGVIEPILVRPVSNKYEIIAGERRYKASVLAGLTKIPAMVRQLDDKESSIIAFIENEHRSNVSAVEEARTMDRILKNNNMTQDELAKELGVNQSTIANKLRLLNLPLEIQESLMRNEISERHARSLLSIKDERKQIELLNKIKERKMTVRELDSEIKNMNDMVNNGNNQMGFNPTNYMNTGNVPNGVPVRPNPEQNDFMNYLNSYDNRPTPVKETPQVGTNNDDFMNYLNNYDNNNPLPVEPVAQPVTPVENNYANPTPSSNDFMNYLNDYNNPSQTAPVVNNEPTMVDNNYANPIPVNNPMPQANDDFMSYLNNYNSAPTPVETNDQIANKEPVLENNNYTNPMTTNMTTAPETDNNDLMAYLNNYNQNSTPVESSEPVMTNAPTIDSDYNSQLPTNEPHVSNDNDLMGYLNNYNNPPTPTAANETVIPNQTLDTSIYENPTPSIEQTPNNMDFNVGNDLNNNEFNSNDYVNNNVTINNVTPPITSSFNQYVEDNENYVDISKESKINSVDEIISKLNTVVNEIKEKSIYKVDTEEIDYDDIYQITIKIDKRDY